MTSTDMKYRANVSYRLDYSIFLMQMPIQMNTKALEARGTQLCVFLFGNNNKKSGIHAL